MFLGDKKDEDGVVVRLDRNSLSLFFFLSSLEGREEEKGRVSKRKETDMFIALFI